MATGPTEHEEHDDERAQGATIADAIERGSILNGHIQTNGKVAELSRQEMRARTGEQVNYARLGRIRRRALSPSFTEAVRLALVGRLSMEELLDRHDAEFLPHRNGIAWRFSGMPTGPRAEACRAASARLLEGQSVDKIREAVEVIYTAFSPDVPVLEEAHLRDHASSGFAMGLVRFETLPKAELMDAEDVPLATLLAEALARDAVARNAPQGNPPVVRVVRNMAHESFGADPAAPFLVARIAHDIVAAYIAARLTVYDIGLSGGMHCSAFVRTAGAETSPFPSALSNNRLTFAPLTLEPFTNHQQPMADVVVGQMVEQARCLLGTPRAEGLTIQSFGYVVDERIDRLDSEVLNRVRRIYRELDIAIYGCGDLKTDGWLESVLNNVNIPGATEAVTDVCLNLLDKDGKSIPLPHGREFVGISQADIRRLAQRPDRLALLLTSGAAKGLPIVAAARAGCVGHLVCDQAAARAALQVLGGGEGAGSES